MQQHQIKRLDLDNWQTDIFSTTKKVINNLSPYLSKLSFATYSLNEIYFVEQDVVLHTDNIFDELKLKITKFQNTQECGYILLNHVYVFEKKLRRKFILIRWSPDTARIKSKMVAASVNSLYLKAFEHLFPTIVVAVGINDEDDLNEDFFSELCLKSYPHPIYDINLGDKVLKQIDHSFNDVEFVLKSQE